MDIATILTNTHSIIKKSMLIATDFLSVGFSSPKTFTLRCMPPSLSFCAKPNGEVAESIIQNNPLSRGERGPSKTMVEGQTRTLTNTLFFSKGLTFPSELVSPS